MRIPKFYEDGPLITASAFSTMAFLDRWARGLGGQWVDANERFIERKQNQGVDALRVFDETTFWHDRDDNPNNDHPFFNENRATSLRMWDYNGLVHGSRPERLTVHHVKILLKLLELARKHDMKIELVVDATLKHSPGVGWDVIGHCIRQTADFLKMVHRGEWHEPSMGHPDDPKSTARIRAMFEAAKGPLDELVDVESHNEFDAHSFQSWADDYRVKDDGTERTDGEVRAKALSETNRQLERFRRDEQWPEGSIGVSHGGRDDIAYQVGYPEGADVIKLHPARSGEWDRVGDRFSHLEKLDAHTYHNETIHFIDPELWSSTVEKGWFRPGSSTKDVVRILDFERKCLAKGYSFCRHGLVEMANGHWVHGDLIEAMPLDAREKATMNAPPPPPPTSHMFLPVIEQAYAEILDRAPDEGGLNHYNEQIKAGMTEAEMRESLLRSDEYAVKNPEEKEFVWPTED